MTGSLAVRGRSAQQGRKLLTLLVEQLQEHAPPVRVHLAGEKAAEVLYIQLVDALGHAPVFALLSRHSLATFPPLRRPPGRSRRRGDTNSRAVRRARVRGGGFLIWIKNADGGRGAGEEGFGR